MLAAADCGPDWWIGVCGISGDTPQRWEVWVSARVAADVKAQKRRTLTKDPQNSMPHRVLEARVLADLKRSRTPCRQIVAGTPGRGL